MTAPQNIDEALLALQAERIVLTKDKAGQVGNQKTRYADLVQANEVILARLQELGCVWKTKPTTLTLAGPNGSQDARFVLHYELRHVASGTVESGDYPLPGGANPMANGSAITYARRYALLAVTNAVADDEDDDGRGYAGRGGMAQRANARYEQTRPVPAPQETAQRAQPAARTERARPAQQPEVPAPATRGRAKATAAGKVTTKQHATMHGMWNELGYSGDENRGKRLSITARQLGLDSLDTSANLTAEQADQMISILSERVQAKRAKERAAQTPPAEAPQTAADRTRAAVTGSPDGSGADDTPPWEPEDGALLASDGTTGGQ